MLNTNVNILRSTDSWSFPAVCAESTEKAISADFSANRENPSDNHFDRSEGKIQNLHNFSFSTLSYVSKISQY